MTSRSEGGGGGGQGILDDSTKTFEIKSTKIENILNFVTSFMDDPLYDVFLYYNYIYISCFFKSTHSSHLGKT